jgi:hypothetical protein
MFRQIILKWGAVCFVVLTAALLAIVGYDVISTVLPDDGILIHASDGARLQVDGRTLVVLSGGAGTMAYPSILLPVSASLFALVVVFALIGAASLFRRGRWAATGN